MSAGQHAHSELSTIDNCQTWEKCFNTSKTKRIHLPIQQPGKQFFSFPWLITCSYMETLLKKSQTAVCELTSIFGAEVQEVMDGIHHLLLLSLQGRAVSCGPAQLGFQLPDHPALTPHQSLETSLLLLQRLQLFPVSHLHF